MATRTQTYDDTTGTANYDVDTSEGLSYEYFKEEYRELFDFLTDDLPSKLDDVQGKIEDAQGITDAFDFEIGSSVKDISKAATNLITDITNLRTGLTTLHDAFMTDIDEINAELDYNYGWVIIGQPSGSVTTVQEKKET